MEDRHPGRTTADPGLEAAAAAAAVVGLAACQKRGVVEAGSPAQAGTEWIAGSLAKETYRGERAAGDAEAPGKGEACPVEVGPVEVG
jgi:hypothetical protein